LKRYSDNLYLAFDMDIAGDFATKRGIDLAQLKDFNLKVVLLEEGKDPADIISENKEKFKKTVENSVSILDFYFNSAFSKFDKNKIEGKKEISEILLPVIKRIQNKIEQSHWISKLAKGLSVREEDIEAELEKIKLEEEKFGLEPEEILNLPKKSRKEILEERLLVLILKSPENLNLINDEKVSFFDQKLKEILINLKKDLKFNLEKISSEAQEFFNLCALKSEIEEIEKEKILPEIKFCLNEIKSIEIKEKLKEISKEIKKAEEEKDFQKIQKLVEKFTLYSKNLSEKYD
jgi:DNA primase